MALALPLIVMTLALLSAWGLGTLTRGKPLSTQRLVGGAAVAGLLLLPLVHDAMIFDGNCYALDGTASPCSLAQRLFESFTSGFAFMLAPALLWVLVYVMSLNTPRS